MSYQRVIPRDLFNEANLLKCYGQIYLNLENMNLPGIELDHDGAPFDIQQCADDGSLTVANVALIVRGEAILMYRPLNSRRPWPLFLAPFEQDEIEVFNDDGSFTQRFTRFLKGD